jgi:hypothetical protein
VDPALRQAARVGGDELVVRFGEWVVFVVETELACVRIAVEAIV